MRVYRFLVLFFVSLVLFSISVISNVEAGIWPTSAATLCWQVTTSDNETGIVRLKSFPMGASNYLLSGKVIFNGKIQNIINGNAVVGTNVLMTVNAAGKDSESFWTSTGYGVLSGATLNGKIESIGHNYNRTDKSIDTSYNTVTITKITCP